MTRNDEIAEDDEGKTDDSKPQLNVFYSQLYATVLEDTILEYRILVECNTEMRIQHLISHYPELLKTKFGIAEPAVVDEVDAIDTTRLECSEYKLDKLVKDRETFGGLMTKIYVQLSTDRHHDALKNYIQAVLKRIAYFKQLMETNTKNKNILRELIKTQRARVVYMKAAKYEADALIDTLKRRIEDYLLITETRYRHIDNWEGARTECHKLTIHNKESVFTDNIQYYKQQSEAEDRVHREVETLTNDVITDTLNEVQVWITKYETDMENIDLKIQVGRNKYEDMRAKRVRLDDMFALHNKQMFEWNKFKEEREIERIYVTTMTQSAITVQAWWRGLMVRRQLGPFKQKKKKKAPKKK